jgi:hypothetical protein
MHRNAVDSWCEVGYTLNDLDGCNSKRKYLLQ